MSVVSWLLLLSAGYPLARAWQATAGTTLRPAIGWLLAAWSCRLLALGVDSLVGLGGDLLAYLALSLAGCAGMAVLGARRPGLAAWNTVVVGGLLTVLLLPIAQGMGTIRGDFLPTFFLALTLALPVVQYLPTRMALAVVTAGVGCGLEAARLLGHLETEPAQTVAVLLVGLAPWLGWPGWAGKGKGVDAVWRSFRDSYGALWALRMREQFNRAAANAGHPFTLGWSGLSGAGPEQEAAALALLRAVLRRFGTVE